MGAPADLIDHLRQARLTDRVIGRVDEAYRSGGASSAAEALTAAGLTRERIASVLQDYSPSMRSGSRRYGRSDADSQRAPAESQHRPTSTNVQPTSEPSVDDLISRLMDITPRFELQGELARGAMGRILAGWDLHLGRAVAIKVLRKSAARDLDRVRFLEEAQVTGQLQHPSIVPVYELGRIRGQVAFVMKRVEGRSIKGIISAMRKGDAEVLAQFGRPRILNLFHQLCLAVAFAHTRGVVHRDLKPSNVMVGDFGEVVLLDWGLCKIVAEGTRSTRSVSDRWQTVHGQIIGTPAYMAPEQAMGLIDQVDARTDVYGLGAILYHLLTLQPPFSGKTNREIVHRVLRETVQPLQERAPEQDIDPELGAIVMQCLARDPQARFENARALADRITEYLDVPRAITQAMPVMSMPSASKHRAIGLAAVARQQSLLEDLALAQDTVQTARAAVSIGDAPDEKHALWSAEDALVAVHTEYADVFAVAISALSRAVALDPADPDASRALCDMFMVRYEAARACNDPVRTAYFRRMLREHDDGRFAVLVSEQGAVHIDVSPRGAQVELIQMEERLRRLQAGTVHQRTQAPLSLDGLAEGPYIVRVHAAGYEPLTAPLHISAGGTTRMRLRLLKAGSIPPDFVHVPAGTFRLGSPRSAHEPPGEHALPDYLIGRVPVTNAQYAAFLDSVAARNPSEADRRSPRAHDGRTPAWTRVGARYPVPEADGWRLDAPVVGVRSDDAAAFCRWRSAQDGKTIRLPTEQEWEKAARGTEGLPFSWGHTWEPAYVAGPETWPQSLPPPVGLVKEDCSPYGMRDTVGGVREWTATVVRGAERRVAVRGGSFKTGGAMGRPLWRRELVHADAVSVDVGFRVLLEI